MDAPLWLHSSMQTLQQLMKYSIYLFTDPEEKMPLAAQTKNPRRYHEGKSTFLYRIDERLGGTG